MSDVRERLTESVFASLPAVMRRDVAEHVADAILARFGVTEKPVVTAEELGRMAQMSVMNAEINRNEFVQRFRGQLAAAGLTIVRIEEAG